LSEKYAIFDITESDFLAPPDPLAAFDGPTSKTGEGKGWEKRGGERWRDATHPL